MLLKSNQDQFILWTRIMWLVNLIIIGCRLTMLPAEIRNGNIVGAIAQGIFLILTLMAGVIRLNTSRYKATLVELLNQVLLCNSLWGQ